MVDAAGGSRCIRGLTMKHVLRVSDSSEDCVAAKCIVPGLAWDLNASDPQGRRNAEHIELIVAVDLVSLQSHLV